MACPAGRVKSAADLMNLKQRCGMDYEDTKEELEKFVQIPWCAALLNDTRYTIEPSVSRYLGKEALMGKTLSTDKTISAYITFYKTPAPEEDTIQEIHSLVTLGPGMDGWPGVLHGGIVATLLDEIMGTLHSANTSLTMNRAQAKGEIMERPITMTAQLNTKYVQPVRTPSTVLLSANFTKIEGRKLSIYGSIKDEDGNVLSEGEALFIHRRAKL